MGNSAILLGVIAIYSLEREVVFHFLVSICWNRHGKNLAESQILRHSSDEGKSESDYSADGRRRLDRHSTPPSTPPDSPTPGADSGRSYAKTLRLTSAQLKSLNLKEVFGKKLNPRNKFLAPSWTSLTIKGEIGEVLNKCKKVLSTLEWGVFETYFEHSLLHWSPWLTKLGIEIDSDYSREVARR